MTFTVAAKPFALWNGTVQHRIAVNVAAVEIALVANEQHIFIVPTTAHIANEVVFFFEYHLLRLHFNNLSILVFVDLRHLIELGTAAWAGS